MNFRKWLLSIVGVIILIALIGFEANIAQAQGDATTPPATTAEQIKTPVTPRNLLLQQFKVLSQQPATPPPKSKTAKTLEDLSKSISNLHFGANQLIAELHRTQIWIEYIKKELRDREVRKHWSKIFLKCILVVGVGYLIFVFSNRFLRRFYLKLLDERSEKFLRRVFFLTFAWILTLAPLVLFVLATYFTLFFMNADETTQWVLLAWICAFVTVNFLETIYKLGLVGIASYPEIKKILSQITALIIYGYFVLQAALYLGLSPAICNFLAKLWGFIIVLVLIQFITRTPWHLARILPMHKIKDMAPEKVTHLEMAIRAVAVIYLLLLYLVWLVQSNHYFLFVLKSTFLSLILIFIAIRIVRFFHHYLTRDFTVSPTFRRRLPGFEKRFRRYRRILEMGLRIFIYLALVLLIIKIWSGGNILWISPVIKEMLIVKTVAIICIIIIAMFVWELSNSLIEISLTKGKDRVTIESGRTHTLLTVARKTIFAALFLITFLMIMSQLGISIAPLLAGVGVVGLAISFGSQKLIQDLITGFFMLLEDQIAVGDVVKIGDNAGTVEAITLRTVRLRDTAGVVHIIPYNSIITVSNMTKEFSYYVLDMGVAYKENTDRVVGVLKEVGAQLQKDSFFSRLILDALEVLGVDKFGDSAVVIKSRIKTKPGMQWQVGREFNRRIKLKFDELNIEIPFPHTVVFFGNSEDADKHLHKKPGISI